MIFKGRPFLPCRISKLDLCPFAPMSKSFGPPVKPSRLASIDSLKGLLIIAVIIGHVALGSLERSWVRYLIYSFHMPLFIGISGYLFDFDRVVPSVATLFRKYGVRLLVPWGLATCGYVMILRLDPTSLVIPYYHLWYVPAFIGCVAMTLLLKRVGASVSTVFIVAACISVLAYLYKTQADLFAADTFAVHTIRKILHTLRPQFYIFFALGILLRAGKIILPVVATTAVAFTTFLITLYLHDHPFPALAITSFFLFNSALLAVGLMQCAAHPLFTVRWLEWLGVNSLGIYLWHALPILLAIKLFGTKDVPLYYGACLLGISAVLLGYALLARYPVPRKYLFGLGAAQVVKT